MHQGILLTYHSQSIHISLLIARNRRLYFAAFAVTVFVAISVAIPIILL